MFHLLTAGAGQGEHHEVVQWLEGPQNAPQERAGASELVSKYKDLGYQIVYVHLAPAELTIGEAEQPLDEAIVLWLELRGFPTGDGTELLSWPSEVDNVSNTEDWDTTRLQALFTALIELWRVHDLDVDVGYSGVSGRAETFIGGGVDRMFTIGEAADAGEGIPIPGDDLIAHLETVDALLEPVCQGRGRGLHDG